MRFGVSSVLLTKFIFSKLKTMRLNKILYNLKSRLNGSGVFALFALFALVIAVFVGPWLIYMDVSWESYDIPEGKQWAAWGAGISAVAALLFTYFLLYLVRKSTPPKN